MIELVKNNTTNVMNKHFERLKDANIKTTLEDNKLTIMMDQEIVKYHRNRSTRFNVMYDPMSKYKRLLENKINDSFKNNNIIINEKLLYSPIKVTGYFNNLPSKSSGSNRQIGYMLKNVLYRTKTPDIDNFQKTAFDILNKIAWNDDAQIIEVHMYKNYNINESTKLVIEYIEEENITGRINAEDIEYFGKRILEKIKMIKNGMV